mgnify:CR=1 FL=1
MLRLLYNLSIQLYLLLVRLAALRSSKAKKWLKGRKDQKNLLSQWAQNFNGSHTVWFQCASLGEFEQARPLIEAYMNIFPEAELLLSFFSPSGYEVRKGYDKAKVIAYLPIDTAENATQWIKLFSPKIAFFTKNEFWWHYLEACKAKAIPVYSICCDFSSEKWLNPLRKKIYTKMWSHVEHFFVMNTASADYLKALKKDNNSAIKYTVTGDTRFDRALQTRANATSIDLIAEFKNQSPLFIFGSAWETDVHIMLPFIKYLLTAQWKVCIAPHEIHREEMQAWQKLIGVEIAAFQSEGILPHSPTSLYFLDTIGQLSAAYQYADAAYVGGGFTGALHNILEPAVFGIPIFVGPKIFRFPEAKLLAEAQLLFPIENGSAAVLNFQKLMNNTKEKLRLQSELKSIFKLHSGATQKIIAHFHTGKHENNVSRQ